MGVSTSSGRGGGGGSLLAFEKEKERTEEEKRGWKEGIYLRGVGNANGVIEDGGWEGGRRWCARDVCLK
jgi:hypothetical protein